MAASDHALAHDVRGTRGAHVRGSGGGGGYGVPPSLKARRVGRGDRKKKRQKKKHRRQNHADTTLRAPVFFPLCARHRAKVERVGVKRRGCGVGVERE